MHETGIVMTANKISEHIIVVGPQETVICHTMEKKSIMRDTITASLCDLTVMSNYSLDAQKNAQQLMSIVRHLSNGVLISISVVHLTFSEVVDYIITKMGLTNR